MKVTIKIEGPMACGKSHLAGYLLEAVVRQQSETSSEIELEIVEIRVPSDTAQPVAALVAAAEARGEQQEAGPMSDELCTDDGPCTDCGDTGITFQTERTCTCLAGLNLYKPDTDAMPTFYDNEPLQSQVDKLAAYILTVAPHAIRGGAIETAVHLIAEARKPDTIDVAGGK